MKKFRKITALFLAVALLVGAVGIGVTAAEDEEMYPAVVIPGLFQCDAKLYDESGNLATNSDGEPLEAPFFLGDTMDLVGTALKHAGLPLLLTLFTQRDWGGMFAQGLGRALGEIVLGKTASDSNGDFIYDVRPVTYDTAVANLSQEDKDYIYDTIPLTTYKDIAGEDMLYFFSYFSFENMDNVIERLYALIQTAKEETGCDKVNIVPISQGGSICNALLETYRDDDAETDIFDELNRIIYVIPALNGAYTLGDIYYNGLLDDTDALYNYMFPLLLDEDQGYLAYLINVLIKIFPEKVLQNALDVAVDILIEDYLENCTLMWGLITSDYYPELRERYLMDEDNAVIREQTDRYYQAQLNSRANVLKAVESGVEVFDIVNYNVSLYPIVDNWNKCQADGIIELNSTSMGAYGIGVDVKLPDGYVQQNTSELCSDPENHVHIDPHNLIDASTGLLPDHTFYFYNAPHERTGNNDIVMKLVVELLTDPAFENVYTYPDRFPQFNTGRNSKGVIRNVANAKALLEDETIDPAIRSELDDVIARAEALIADTACTPEEVAKLSSCDAEINAIRRFISTGSYEEIPSTEDKAEEFFIGLLTDVLYAVHTVQYAITGGGGFFDIPGYNA